MSFHLVALLVFVLIVASAPLTAATLRREAERAARRAEPMPRAANYWLGVHRRAAWLAGAGAALLAAGLALRYGGYEALGRVCIISAAAAWGYLVHAHIVARGIERGAKAGVTD